MKTFTIAAITAFATLLAVPAAAQTTPLVIPFSSADRTPVARVPLSLEQRITNAAQTACERPTLRSTRAQQLYRACVADVSAELAARYQSSAITTVAAR